MDHPALIGRRGELAALRGVLGGAGGHAHAFVVGEAGIGKTRLVETAREAEDEDPVDAVVLTEPVMTNAGIIAPSDGFHAALRELTRATGTLLALDETHSLVGADGGMAGELGLETDFLTVGKSIAAGIPLGAYGMSGEIAARSQPTGGHNLAAGRPTPRLPPAAPCSRTRCRWQRLGLPSPRC